MPPRVIFSSIGSDGGAGGGARVRLSSDWITGRRGRVEW